MDPLNPQLTADVSGTVYILDDDEDVLRFLELAIRPLQLRIRAYQRPDQLLAEPMEPPDCLIVDWQLKGADGLEVIARCQARWPLASVILISGKATIPITVTAMRQGVVCVLEKPVRPEELRREIQAACHLGRRRTDADLRQKEARALIEELNDNERAVLQLIVQGIPNKRIAAQMNLAMRTIEKYRSALFSKLGVESAAEAAQIWLLSNLENERAKT